MRGIVIAWLLMALMTGIAFAQLCDVERDAKGKITRSTSALRAFQKLKPCPATNLTTGPCPGYVIDHIRPRCACGPDTPENMQWQELAESREKDRAEVAYCGWLGRARQ
jgi:hypothetical protein